MEPVEVILSALVAGALSGAAEITGSAIKDAYKELVSLVTKKLSSNKAAKSHWDNYLKDFEAWEKPAKKCHSQGPLCYSLAAHLQLARGIGAKRVLLPSNELDLGQIIFYSAPIKAAFLAMGMD